MPLVPTVKVGWDLAIDIYEEKGNVIVEMNLPGIDPDKLEITVHDGYLRIAGSRVEERENRDKNYFCKEIKRGAFERTVKLPARVKQDKADAQCKNGTLKILLPKLKEEKTGRISVKVQ
jgi:HSP20 family protein